MADPPKKFPVAFFDIETGRHEVVGVAEIEECDGETIAHAVIDNEEVAEQYGGNEINFSIRTTQ